ncbi:YIP1 family protein [Salinirussus salinus]|uniref:YIP1 family protein n=1 Tax=Salinirussus salinus TaxID=1198300 RepID=UPI00135B5CDE|nr:YIP1 family protein [Salinirussus salinus]
MTQWAENTDLGRERGPVAVLRAWVEVLVSPRRFFRGKVAPGDQAPGLTFVAAVVLVSETVRLAVVDNAYPVIGGQPAASAVLWVLFVVVLVAPAGVHLTAALQTVILIGTVEDRAGVSETVQVLCYATAPCVLVGLANPWVTGAVTVWGTVLFVVGVSEVHSVPLATALAVAAVPAALAFGYGFGGLEALAAVAEQARLLAGQA